VLVLDTHVLLHALAGQLSARETRVLSAESWSICAITLWEIAKLAQLGRVEIDLDDADVVRALARVHTWPLTLAICRESTRLDFRGDPADELIAATSVVHGVPLATRDRAIRRSHRLQLAW
jgi:PIN domain nuclease of toxin-antitoxin system